MPTSPHSAPSGTSSAQSAAKVGRRVPATGRLQRVPPIVAAQTGTWEKLKHIPVQNWINIAICIAAIFIIIKAWRVLKNFNSYAPYIASMVAMAIIFFYWVYNRTEPAFLTPIVNHMVEFLPSKH